MNLELSKIITKNTVDHTTFHEKNTTKFTFINFIHNCDSIKNNLSHRMDKIILLILFSIIGSVTKGKNKLVFF